MRSFYLHFMVYFLSIFTAHSQTVSSEDWTNRIVSKTKYPIISLISPHVSPINILIIDGKRYENVRGVKKFYLQVPKSHSIVFAVNKKKGSAATYHIFNMDTDEDIAVETQTFFFFGNTIGANSENTIDVKADGIIVLCNTQTNAGNGLWPNLDSYKSFTYVDLKKKAIVAEKTLYYDKDGKLIKEDSIGTQK